MNIEVFKKFLGREIQVIKKTNERCFFFNGKLLEANEDSDTITLQSDKFGLTVLEAKDINQIEEKPKEEKDILNIRENGG